ncbi:MAG: hypothetical protein Q4E50_02735 [Tissierellia bacterium]|nr:hypothetical protein [Tissierellia bacterium]
MYNFLLKSYIYDIYESFNAIKFYLQKLPILRKIWKNSSFAMRKIKKIFEKLVLAGKIFFMIIKKIFYIAILLGLSIPINKILLDAGYGLASVKNIFLGLYAYLGIFNFFRFIMDSSYIKNMVFYEFFSFDPRKIALAEIFLEDFIDVLFMTLPLILIDSQLDFGLVFIIKLQIMYILSRYISNSVNLVFLDKKIKRPGNNMVLSIISLLMIIFLFVKDVIFGISSYEFLDSKILFIFMLACGLMSIYYILKKVDFNRLFITYSQGLDKVMELTDEVKFREQGSQLKQEDMKVSDRVVKKDLEGYFLLNELFFQRHRRLIFRPIIIKTLICLAVCVGVIIASFYLTLEDGSINADVFIEVIFKNMPSYLPFAGYLIFYNQSITRIMFINCDQAFLQYDFYKRPKDLLEMFRLRLMKLLLWNSLPMLVILALMLGLKLNFNLDGTMVFTSMLQIISLWVFFSLHTLFVYYVFQPYNDKYEHKSPAYMIVNFLIYVISYATMMLKPQGPLVGPISIGLATAYIVIALILVYRVSPRTFKVRNRT